MDEQQTEAVADALEGDIEEHLESLKQVLERIQSMFDDDVSFEEYIGKKMEFAPLSEVLVHNIRTDDGVKLSKSMRELQLNEEELSQEVSVLAVTEALELGVDTDKLLREAFRRHFLERAEEKYGKRSQKYAYSNALLDELVRTKPRTENALRRINGMGPWRMESSEEILRIIDVWLMGRCVHAINSKKEFFDVGPDAEISITPLVLDNISEQFIEWARGRDDPPKRISSAGARQKILEELSNNHGKLRVSELRDGLADMGMSFSPSRLSQIITSIVEEGLIVRSKPAPFERGVVILELTEKGLQTVWETSSH